MNHEIHNTPEFTPDFSLLAFLSGEIQSTKYYVRNYQINMQNKPNIKDAQINVNSSMKSKYENLDTWLSVKNKPNSNPIKANLRKAKMNLNLTLTKDYIKNDDFSVRINKPNFQNAKSERKLNFNKGLQKKRFFSSHKTNPIQTQFLQRPKSLTKKSGHTRLAGVPKIVCKNTPFGYTHLDCRASPRR